jgi:hypothetical protein
MFGKEHTIEGSGSMSVVVSETAAEQPWVPGLDHGWPNPASLLSRSWKPIQHLLWREFRILCWWLVASLALAALTMILSSTFLVGRGPMGVNYSEFTMLLYVQSFIAPGTFLIGALTASFANDRNDMSFQWCTTLPVHWVQSIIVKLFLSCIGAIACWWIALILTALIDATVKPVEPLGIAAVNDLRWDSFRAASSPAFFTAFFVMYSVSLIGIQICRQATHGIFLAICLSITFLALWLSDFREYSQHDGRDSSLIYSIKTIFGSPLICGCLFLALASWLYRWRWYRAMYSNVAPTNFLEGRQPKVDDSSNRWPLSWSIPNQQLALFWLARKKAVLAWWWCVPLSVSMIFLSVFLNAHSDNVLMLLAPLGFLLLLTLIGLGSIWSFFGERGGEAESFLAERGVCPTRHWWSRYLVSSVGGTLVLLSVLYLSHLMDSLNRGETIVLFPPNTPRAFFAFLIMGVHGFTGVCLLAGQTFRRWQLAVIAVAAGSVVFAFLLGSAILTAGFFGGLLCFGLVLTAIPLSWCLSKQAATRWQPNLDWVYPLFATVVVSVIVFLTPWVRLWVLPPQATELSAGRTLPSFSIPSLPPHDMQPLLSQEILRPWTNIRTMFATVNSDEIRTASKALQPQLRQYLDLAERSKTSMLETQISDVANARNYFNSLGVTAFVALELGDAETAELALKLRIKILTDLRPIAGIFEFDSLQTEFLEALRINASFEALQLLKKLKHQDKRLLSDPPEQARAIWAESIEAQASYLYRNGHEIAHGAKNWLRHQGGRGPVSSSDTWLARTRLGSSFTEVFGIMRDVPVFVGWADLEQERFRREISFAYRNFQDYLNTGKVTPGLHRNELLDLGAPSFVDSLSGQIAEWDRQSKALARLEARLNELEAK